MTLQIFTIFLYTTGNSTTSQAPPAVFFLRIQPYLEFISVFRQAGLPEFLCVSVLRVASGPRVKLASCKSALKPPVVYSTDRSKAVVLVLVLLFVALWFIL